MINGDISNETPPRIIVVIGVVAEYEDQEIKKLFGQTKIEKKIKALKNKELSRLWNASFNYGLAVELAAFKDEGWTEELAQGLMNRLDNRGGNPFNYMEMYESFRDLVDELPYRSNLKAVIDEHHLVARYGSRGLDLNNL